MRRLVSLAAAIVLVASIVWALALPSITTLPSCPPQRPECDAVETTDARLDTRALILLSGVCLFGALKLVEKRLGAKG